jgi:two-component system phosphate regulon sensor histidine kinase PhoR
LRFGMKFLAPIKLLPIASLALSSALAAVWLFEWDVAPLTPLARWGFLTVSVALSGGALVLLLDRAEQGQKAVRRYFELLCRVDHRDLSGETSATALPALPPGNPWHDVFHHVREQLAQYARHSHEAEHARAAAEIRAQRGAQRCEQLTGILAALPEPVVAVDEYENVVLTNASAAQLLFCEDGDVQQRTLSHLSRCEKLVEMLQDARRRRSPAVRACEVQLASPDGAPRWYNLSARSLAASGASGDEGHGAVAVLRDISSLKAIQKRNAEFVSAVSHEMKTPLAGIKAYVELLADGDADDEATREEFLRVINGQADRLQRLIDNLLNLARMEAGVVAVNKNPQSLNDILEEAYHVVQPSAQQKNIALHKELSPMYLGVLVDRDLALQAAINLLSNAIKYTPPAGRVCLRSHMEEHRVRFEVEDTGVGISPEDCQKIFEKFYRVKKDQQMAQGTGLGLPLARHIVEEIHNGSLCVNSEPGVGSTFTVTLPKAAQLT